MTTVPESVRMFDEWRARYDEMSFEDQAAFYEDVASRFPEQAHFQLAPALRALEGCDRVDEVGGWQGDLAAEVLARRPDFRYWLNWEICDWAANRPATRDPRYFGFLLADHPWCELTPPPPAETAAFVATHFIEHIRYEELELLTERVMCYYPVVYLEAPIPEDATDFSWDGYNGSHILEVGWLQVSAMLQAYGLEPDWREGDCRCFVQR